MRTIEDGATAFQPTPGEIPEHWNRPQPAIKPKVATLHGATLLSDGAALLPDGSYCHHDHDTAFTPADVRESFHSEVMQAVHPEADVALIERPPFRREPVSGRCFSAWSNNPDNMGHFIHDVLSRIYYEDLGAIAPGREKILAPRFHFPMQKMLFERVFAEYEIVDPPRRAAPEVEELLLPANLCSESRINAAAIYSLAKRLRRIAEPWSGRERLKVCVSRGDGRKYGGIGGREFVNMSAFETRMREMGYRVVEISKIDPENQLALWANAAGIVGIHGAGMMNMMFMPPGGGYAEVGGAPPVETKPKRLSPNWGARCAMIAGHRVGGLLGGRDVEGRPVIDIERLEAILRRIS